MKRTLPTLVTSLCVLAASSHGLAKPKAAPAAAASAPATPPPSPPAAEPAPAKSDAATKKEAGERFKRGTELYSEGEYSLALAEFERAYTLVPDYRVLYNIGQVNIQLGQYARARVMLKEYMLRGVSELSAERLKSVQGDLEMLAGRTALVVLEVEPEGVEVTIDGKLVGTTPVAEPVVVDVGERRIDLKRSGFVAQGQTLSLAGGDRYVAQFKLVAEAPASDRSGADRPVALLPDKPAPAKTKPIVYAGYATTGALAAGAIVTGVLGASAASDLKDLRNTLGVTQGEMDDARDRAQARFMVAQILGAAALATGVVTIYLHVSGAGKERPRTANNVWVNVAPSQITLGMNPSFLQ
jgi:hypothetical protein